MSAMSTLAERARLRIREEMARKDLSQREVADLLRWSQSRVARALTGRAGIDLDEVEALCFACGLSVVEAVRDRGMEFCAEMTPTELRILEKIRAADKTYYEALLTILHVRPSLTAERHAGPQPKSGVQLGKSRPR